MNISSVENLSESQIVELITPVSNSTVNMNTFLTSIKEDAFLHNLLNYPYITP